MDTKPIGGEVAGDVEGEIKAGDVAGGKKQVVTSLKEQFKCKICGTVIQTFCDQRKHMTKKHSEFAISIATQFNHIKPENPQKLNKCESCGQNFFFLETWKRHTRKCHIDMSMIGGGEDILINIKDNESDSDNVTANLMMILLKLNNSKRK